MILFYVLQQTEAMGQERPDALDIGQAIAGSRLPPMAHENGDRIPAERPERVLVRSIVADEDPHRSSFPREPIHELADSQALVPIDVRPDLKDLLAFGDHKGPALSADLIGHDPSQGGDEGGIQSPEMDAPRNALVFDEQPGETPGPGLDPF